MRLKQCARSSLAAQVFKDVNKWDLSQADNWIFLLLRSDLNSSGPAPALCKTVGSVMASAESPSTAEHRHRHDSLPKPWGEEGGGQGAPGPTLHPHPVQGAGPAAPGQSIDCAVSVPFPGGSSKL